MSTMAKIILAAILVALGVGAGYCWFGWRLTQQDLYLTGLKLSNVQASLESYQRQLSETRGNFTTIAARLQTTQGWLSVVENELQKTKDNIKIKFI